MLVGVDPAAQTVLAGDELPHYVGREVDEALRDAVAEALDGRGHSRLTDATTALACARGSSVGEVAARAGFNLGVVLGELGRSADAVGAYEVLARYGDDPAPALREAVARAVTALRVAEEGAG